jgi:hypothetical protein
MVSKSVFIVYLFVQTDAWLPTIIWYGGFCSLKNPLVKDLQSGENIIEIENYLITQFKEL